MAGSDFSRPFIVGYGSSPSRRDPAARAPRMSKRSPGSRTKSLRACQVLRPRRAGRRLTLAPPFVWPSVQAKTSAPGIASLSRLNGWPARPPADASPQSSRSGAHGAGPMRIVTPSSQWTFTTYSSPVSRRTACRRTLVEKRRRCSEPGPEPKPVLRQAQDEVCGKPAGLPPQFHRPGSACGPVSTQDEGSGKPAVHRPQFHPQGRPVGRS